MGEPNTVDFLKEKFKSYYSRSFVDSVTGIEKREFGIGEFGKKIISRHLSFNSSKAFNDFLRDSVPFFVSYSAAYYEFPERRPMEAKKFISSDLIYEFDADDLKTDCKERHDKWTCPKCGAEGKGRIDNCTECGERVEAEEWVCPECLQETKKQTLKLIEFLQNDFGLSEGIEVNFSGSKGFHVHVKAKEIQQLNQNARIELLDYLTAENLDLRANGFVLDARMLHCPREEEAVGWSKKILEALIELFAEGNAEKISSLGGIRHKKAEEFLKEKQKIISSMKKGLLLPLTSKPKNFWNALITHLIDEIKLDLDRQTSVDISKIIRVPDSIHGSTGLIAKRISLQELKKFSPLKESIIFSNNSTKVYVKDAPKFSLGGKDFGPFREAEAELPEFAAIYLLARNSAEIR